MVDKNIALWEDKMTVDKRRIFTIKFVSKVFIHVNTKEQDWSIISDFEHTGLIITMIANDGYDNKKKPQGMPIEAYTVPKVHSDREKQCGAVEQQIEGQYE